MIECYEVEEIIGEVHNDAWNDGYVRVFLDTWKDEKKWKTERLGLFLENNGYRKVEVGYSGNSFQIVRDVKDRVCSECDCENIAFDGEQNEFYCPMCER